MKIKHLKPLTLFKHNDNSKWMVLSNGKIVCWSPGTKYKIDGKTIQPANHPEHTNIDVEVIES